MSKKDVMHDGYGRCITYLRLSVTDRCNLRCRYCMPAGGVPMLRHQDIMSFEELREVVAAAASLGVTKVRLTGGEPLVRRGIVDLVGMVASVPGVREVAMTTNGTLLSPMAADLRAAGLSRVNVSLDTLDAERYAQVTRGGRLEDALSGLRAAIDAGFERVKVNCVLVGGFNDDEVARVAGLARELPIDVRFIELMPLGPSVTWPQARFVPAERVLEALPDAVPVELWASGPVCPGANVPTSPPRDSGPVCPGANVPTSPPRDKGDVCPAANVPTSPPWDSGPVCPAANVPTSPAGDKGDVCPGANVPTSPQSDPGVAELYQVPGWAGRIGLIRPMGHRFCSQCNRIRVTSDGMLKPCLHSSQEIPLRGLHGDALVDAIRHGIQAKPEGHHMDASEGAREASQSARAMNEIGG